MSGDMPIFPQLKQIDSYDMINDYINSYRGYSIYSR